MVHKDLYSNALHTSVVMSTPVHLSCSVKPPALITHQLWTEIVHKGDRIRTEEKRERRQGGGGGKKVERKRDKHWFITERVHMAGSSLNYILESFLMSLRKLKRRVPC